MNRKLALAPLGMLIILAAQPAVAQPTGGCIATADLGILSYLNTIRVTHQTQPLALVVENNLCFQVVEPDGDVLGDFCETLDLNHSVTHSIAQIYQMASVPPSTPLAPNLVQVVETDGNSVTHDMQATYGSPAISTQRYPLEFTCPPLPPPPQ